MSTGFFAPEVRHSELVRKPVMVWSSGALGGIFPCRHPWLETAAQSESLRLRPHTGRDRAAPTTEAWEVAIWILAHSRS